MGLIAGLIARSLLKRPGGLIGCLVTGCIGATVGGWLGDLLFNRGLGSFFSLWSWALAIGGSVLVLWLYGKITGRK
jgi:uncharacterized membrane protein YeaQ/YmgE (transglycosylase-associated protein family)